MPDQPIGYVVLAKRPDNQGGFGYEPAGAVWPNIEPVVNHRGWCQAQAAEQPRRYGDVEYVVGVIRVVPHA